MMTISTLSANWSKHYMQPSSTQGTPLHPQVAELVTKLAAIIQESQVLINLVTQREYKISQAIMELQKEEFDKAKVLQLLG